MKTTTLGAMLKLEDLPIEEKEQLKDAILYSAEHEGEFYSEVNHVKLDGNKTSMVFVRSYLPEIDKSSDRYKNGLVEGITPDPESINEAEFSVPVMEIGWYFKFTNKAVNHAWSDIKARCAKYLQNIFRTYHDEKIADAYLSSANTVTSVDLLELKDLLRLNTILFKNGAQTFGGFYKLKVAPEVADAMLAKYKDIITHTTQKEAVVLGEIGEIAGFRVIKSRLKAFQIDGSNNYAFVAYGKTMKGEFPVSICAYDDMAESIILTPLGGLGEDPLKQRGAIGLYLDGHGFYVANDEVCVVGSVASSTLSSYMSSASMTHGDSALKFQDAYRSQLDRNGKAREIVPSYDYVKIFRYSGSSGTTANTLALTAKKADGSAWTFGSSATNLNSKVVSGSAVSISGATITTAGTGVATIELFSVDEPNIKTFVVVEVIAGNSNGVNPVLD